MEHLVDVLMVMAFFMISAGLFFMIGSLLKKVGASKKTEKRLVIVVVVALMVTFIAIFGGEGDEGRSSYDDYWGDRARRP